MFDVLNLTQQRCQSISFICGHRKMRISQFLVVPKLRQHQSSSSAQDLRDLMSQQLCSSFQEWDMNQSCLSWWPFSWCTVHGYKLSSCWNPLLTLWTLYTIKTILIIMFFKHLVSLLNNRFIGFRLPGRSGISTYIWGSFPLRGTLSKAMHKSKMSCVSFTRSNLSAQKKQEFANIHDK